MDHFIGRVFRDNRTIFAAVAVCLVLSSGEFPAPLGDEPARGETYTLEREGGSRAIIRVLYCFKTATGMMVRFAVVGAWF